MHAQLTGAKRRRLALIFRVGCLASFILALLGMPPARAQPAAASELTYQDAALNWEPAPWACTVLSSKYGPFKFITDGRGGVSTCYVSEVLGDCPLIPTRAPLMARLDESVQVVIGTGDPADFRTAQRPGLKQRLLNGYLPIMTTTWRDASGLDYEQQTLARNLEGGFEATTGNENGLALIRLKIRNPSAESKIAKLTLAINRSPNAQPHGISAKPYEAGLEGVTLGADNGLQTTHLLTPAGQIRVAMRGPRGTLGSGTLSDLRTQILEWDATAEPIERPAATEEEPFNREFKIKGSENRQGHKSFDRLPKTWWEPKKFPDAPDEKLRGLGLTFPAPQWLRSVTIEHTWDRIPALPGGYRLEIFDGKQWIEQPHTLNGRPQSELDGTTATQQQIGFRWKLETQPVLCQGFRLIATQMAPLPADQLAKENVNNKPRFCEITYAISADNAGAPAEAVYDSSADNYATNTQKFDFPLAPYGSSELVVAVPYLAVDKQKIPNLAQLDFDAELDHARAYWEGELARGTQIHVPEQIVQEIWNTNVPHMFTTAMLAPELGKVLTPTAIGWYEAIWPTLSAAQIIALDQRGLHAEAAIFLEPFLDWQGLYQPLGDYDSREGFLTSDNAYTWIRWSTNHGWLLWALGEHYLLSADADWMARATPHIVAGCEWIERERKRTKRQDDKGEKVPEWGLLPKGQTGDNSPITYYFFNDGVAWRGLDSSATALERIGHPRAAEFRAAADEYRACIQRSAELSVNYTKPFKLKNGEQVPLVGIDLNNVWKTNSGEAGWDKHAAWIDIGPLHALDLGAIDRKSDIVKWMMQVADDSFLQHGVSHSEAFYCPQRTGYIALDDMPGFMRFFYTLCAQGVDRDTYVPVESHYGVQNLPWADGEFTKTLRQMLIEEQGTTLAIAQAVPRLWMATGQEIKVANAPTYFGNLSFAYKSELYYRKCITAWIDPPKRHPAEKIAMRFRHPEGKPIARVTVNGAEWKDWQDQWVNLPASSSQEIAVYYE